MALGLVCRRYKEFIQKSRNAMMMHLNTRSRTFLVDRPFCKISRMRFISSPQARAVLRKSAVECLMPILNHPIVFGTAHVISMLQDGSVDVFGTSADVVEPNSTCSAISDVVSGTRAARHLFEKESSQRAEPKIGDAPRPH